MDINFVGAVFHVCFCILKTTQFSSAIRGTIYTLFFFAVFDSAVLDSAVGTRVPSCTGTGKPSNGKQRHVEKITWNRGKWRKSVEHGTVATWQALLPS